MQLEQEKRTLHQLQRQYNAALSTVNAQIAMLQAKGQTPSRQNRIAYQKQLKEQLEATIAKLHSETYQTIEQFMNDSYTTGYVGAMYDLHGQGLPVIAPIDKDAVVKAVMTDTKLKHGVYRELGSDMATLKKKISNELTRGIATGMAYDDIARNIRMATGAPKARANAIVRTEGHRIQQASQEDARQVAKSKGADVVKQWDATLDSATRDSHRKLDGQIRELDEPFEINGLSAMYPGEFGDPAEDCNCRCVALTRARAALDADELETMQERAKTFKLDKSKSFADFQEKYLKMSEPLDNSGKYGIIKEGKNYVSSKGFVIHEDKIKSYFLKPGADHYQEFYDAGYRGTEGYMTFDAKVLALAIESGFDMKKATDSRPQTDGGEKFSIFMNLGYGKGKRFRTVWKIDAPGSKPRLITAHRED